MTENSLTLYGPAGDLWESIANTVREELARISDAPTPYAIGGGSILAARWKHRHSYDIDLQTPPDAPIGMLAEKHNPGSGFERRLRSLGGHATFFPEIKLWTVEFGDRKRKLDIWAHAPLLGSGQQSELINGRPETTLSNGQILRGKLERADEPLARDVFDIIKASAKDPGGLEAAVNAVGRNTAAIIARAYHWAGPAISADSENALAGIPTTEKVNPRQLGPEAARAITGALYTKCRIQTRGNNKVDPTSQGSRLLRSDRAERVPRSARARR